AWATAQADDDLAAQARAALEKAVAFFTGKGATHGGYLWEYTADLKQRWCEGRATETQIWLQPPGTPSVSWRSCKRARPPATHVTGEPRAPRARR
ncbi:MAG: hypothetical protein N2689_08700, partial [Verrucomicrobiae bacterium]|nr:hypothetical protein [Verrucomicrobiae bacterium]